MLTIFFVLSGSGRRSPAAITSSTTSFAATKATVTAAESGCNVPSIKFTEQTMENDDLDFLWVSIWRIYYIHGFSVWFDAQICGYVIFLIFIFFIF